MSGRSRLREGPPVIAPKWGCRNTSDYREGLPVLARRGLEENLRTLADMQRHAVTAMTRAAFVGSRARSGCEGAESGGECGQH